MNRVQPEKRSKLYWAFSDFSVLTKRSMVYIVRNMDQALSTVFMPIMFLLLFRYVFGELSILPGYPMSTSYSPVLLSNPPHLALRILQSV